MKIETVELFSENLDAQIDFYHHKLGLDILEESKISVSFQIGYSVLKLIKNENFTPYHFAINIPSNLELEALSWLKQRVEILKDGTLEIQDFDFWNAKAVYFYDADNNIVELIARRNLNINSNEKFCSQSLLNISEIGLPTLNIKKEFEILNKACNIPIHSGSFERFCSVGDDNGLFILINKKLKKEWFPTQDKPYSSPFIISFIENGIKYKFGYKNEVLRQLDSFGAI